MKKQDGSNLKFIETVADNCNIGLFAMSLLGDDNGLEVDVLEADYAHKGTEAFVKAIVMKWLTKRSPAAPCTYEHLQQCLRDAELDKLADNLAVAVGGMLCILIFDL